MTYEFYIITLLACAAVTAYITQKAKAFLDKQKIKYTSNMLAVIIGFTVGAMIAALEIRAAGYQITTNTVLFIIAVAIGSVAGAMFGYDKVVQWLKQVRELKTTTEKAAEESKAEAVKESEVKNE